VVSPRTPERRRLLFAGLFAALLQFTRRSSHAAPTDEVVRQGGPVHDRMRKGSPPGQPLDSMMVFERGDNSDGRAMTHEVLSLIHEEKGKNSFPWTMYASLDTHHEQGDGCVVCSRLHKHGPGWSTGLHSEVFSHNRAVALGVNIEMSCDYVGPEATNVIGLNIQAVDGPKSMQYGIQVHDGKGHFETAVGLNGAGKTGVDIKGKFDTGIDLHGNTLRLGEGASIEFGDSGVKMRYLNGRIEFMNGDKCVGHLNVNGADHAI
jgi:hypothetical protein